MSDRRPTPGLLVLPALAGLSSAHVVSVGEQDKPLGHDPNFFDRAAWAVVVERPDGSLWNTKVWWTGASWSYHCTGPFFTRYTPVAEHTHECTDREDDVCGPRGFCRCACGAIRRWASRERLKADPNAWLDDGPPWEMPASAEDLIRSGYITPAGQVTDKGRARVALVEKIGAAKLRGLELDPSLPWWMDVFRYPFDEARESGVAIVQLSWSPAWEFERMLGRTGRRPACKMPFFGKLFVLRCTIPREHKYTVMLAIALGFCDGWYSAEKINQREQHWAEEYYERRTIPTYEALRNRITDGFGFEDEPGSGDWIIACRIALDLTKERYTPFDISRSIL